MNRRAVALMFPGQGSQHTQMASGLYLHEPVFTAAMDEVFSAFGNEGEPLRSDWLAEHPAVSIDHVTRAQPLLFAVDYALGRMLLSWGIRPAALLGHSVGEMAAATLADVFTLDDAAALILDRVRRLAAAPPGGMLAVAAGTEALEPFLTAEVVVAAMNAPRQTILAGPNDPLDAVAVRLRDAGLTCQRVPSLTAFHTPMLAEATGCAIERFAATPVMPPRMLLYSGYTAEPLTGEKVADPAYWASQPVDVVRFWPALDALLGQCDDVVCVEAGPGQGLARIARRHPTVRTGRGAVVSLLPARPGPAERDRESVAAAFDTLADYRATLAVTNRTGTSMVNGAPPARIASNPAMSRSRSSWR
ncbi:MAG: acyltransferase domain-containing protein [Pseudonocardiaceae bacterium]